MYCSLCTTWPPLRKTTVSMSSALRYWWECECVSVRLHPDVIFVRMTMNVRTQDFLLKYIRKFLYFKCIVYYVLLSNRVLVSSPPCSFLSSIVIVGSIYVMLRIKEDFLLKFWKSNFSLTWPLKVTEFAGPFAESGSCCQHRRFWM